jgi:multiple sugar transport system substrate-binding protein
MDAISPLDQYADTKMFNEKFYPSQKDLFVKNDKTWGYLCGVTSSALFYNKNLFDAAGLKPPTTYDEMIDAAKKLTKAPNQYGLGVSTADQPQVNEAVDRYLYGYDTLWGKGKEVLANSPKTVEAISKLKGVIDAGVTPLNQNNPVNRPMFWEGKLAMWMDGPWMPGMTDKPIAGLATTKVPLPSGSSSGGAQVLSFSKNGTNKEAAGKYLNFISKPEWQKVMTVESGNIAGLMGIDYSDYVKERPWYQTFIDALPTIQINSAPGWEMFNEQWLKVSQSKIAEMYAKNRPAKTVCDEIQTEFEKLVKANLK